MPKNFRTKLLKSVHVLLLISMIFVWVSPTFALRNAVSSSDQQPSEDRFRENLENKQAYEEAMIIMEQYLIVGDEGLLHLSMNIRQEEINPDVFNLLRNQIQETNKLIRAGELSLDEIVLVSTGRNVLGAELTLSEYSSSKVSHCAGWTGIIYTAWGPRYYFNECHTQAIQGMLWAGTGGTAICAAIAAYLGAAPVALICALAAGLGSIGAGAIQAVDGLGGNQGIYFQMSWTSQILWMWHQ